MRALVASDLHFEFHADHGASFVASMPEADVLICPGDLSSGSGICDALEKLLKKFPHVVYTFGNHEFYGSSLDQVKRSVARFQQGLGPGYGQLHVLDNTTCEIEGRRFVGTTLWFQDHPTNFRYEYQLNDFRMIKGARADIYAENERAMRFLQETVEAEDIVLTHHLPSLKSVAEPFEGSPLNRFFVCDVEPLILERQPRLWVHGHTHFSCDYGIGRTQVVCNPFGYARHDINASYIDEFVLEI